MLLGGRMNCSDKMLDTVTVSPVYFQTVSTGLTLGTSSPGKYMY